jgi:hypothetical protein
VLEIGRQAKTPLTSIQGGSTTAIRTISAFLKASLHEEAFQLVVKARRHYNIMYESEHMSHRI